MTLLQWLTADRRRVWIGLAAGMGLVVLTTAARYYIKYERLVDRRLEDGRWRAPSRLYAQPVLLRPGLPLAPSHLVRILEGTGYRRRSAPGAPGEYAVARDRVTVFPRAAAAAAAWEPLAVCFHDGRVTRLEGARSRRPYASQPLEPMLLTFLLDEQRERRHLVRSAEIPDHLVKAVVAIEDRRFFSHGGVDPLGIVRAAAKNIEVEAFAQGASTITQQLARNSFLRADKTLKRKFQEALLSFVLERRLTKPEILELYLNEIYLGQVDGFNIYGVGQAARTYFGKEVGELTLAQSALLAGMIQSPNGYNPYRHPEAALLRRDQVLRAMAAAGLLHDGTVDFAVAQPLDVRPPTLDAAEAPYFVELVKEQLARGYRRRELARRNLSIQTSLDLPLQMLAEDVLGDGLAAFEREHPRREGPPLQGALVALEPRSGAVLALVGGRSHRTSPFNRALRARRQPGSAFKPFVYLAAFEATLEGRAAITPATLVEDVPSTFLFEDERYSPRNNDGRYAGSVTARRALTQSLNVATVKVAEAVGYDAVAELWSKKLGLGPIRPYPALALGSFEATPLELAAAYNVLASGGLKVVPSAILSVADERRAAVASSAGAPQQVVHAASAFLVTNMLRSVINEGTAYSVRERGFVGDAAGKTGTTNNSRDAWFAGFTPELLCVVWVGYDDNASLQTSAAEAALPIWVAFMKKALAGRPSPRFEAPAHGVVFRSIDKDSGLLARAECPRVLSEAFLAGTEPRRYCSLHHEQWISEEQQGGWLERLATKVGTAVGKIF